MIPFFTLFLLNSIIVATVVTVSCLTPDGLSLLSLKAAISSPRAFSDWNESDADPCRWSGISCAVIPMMSYFPRVVAVSIPGSNLSGYLPSELGNLLFLRRLNLHGNNLSGSIPPSLLNATSLHSVFLAGNQLSGEIPTGICVHLPRLQNLDLSGNSLSGGLPPDLPYCHQLQRLILARNSLSGHLPAGIGSLLNLVQLDLSSNDFNGSLPAELGSLSALSGTLNLSSNSFSGGIPTALGQLPVSVSLDLRDNRLSGPIPLDGSLSNQAPTAFLHNPGLCGLPLHNPCGNPKRTSPERGHVSENALHRKRLSSATVVGISVGDAALVAVIILVAVAIYRQRQQSGRKGCSCRGEERFGQKGWCCILSGKLPEKDTGATAVVGGDSAELVVMDRGFGLNLDELLRASAYVLGKGGRGIVYKVLVGDGVPVVVRRLGGGDDGPQKRREFTAEVQRINRIRHPNLVRVRAFCWAPEEKLIVSDFIANGNLASALHGGRSGRSSPNLSWSTRLKIAKGTARGLTHIHECSARKYLHGDIKPTNILLDSNFNPHISDFGLSRLVRLAGSDPNSTSGYIGSVLPRAKTSKGATTEPVRASTGFSNCYKAPEDRVDGSKPTQKSDVYSFGVVLLELLTGCSPMSQHATMGMDLVDWVRKVFYEELPLSEIMDPILLPEVHSKREILSAFHIGLVCTEASPETRPKMKSVLESVEKMEDSSTLKHR